MRITIPIVSHADRWRAEIPAVDVDACYDGEGEHAVFSCAKFAEQVRDKRGILVSSTDTGAVEAFAAILLSSLGDWFADNSRGSLRRMKHTAERLQKRVERGQVAFCRIDIKSKMMPFGKSTIRGVQIAISATDNGVVQQARFDEDFALLVLALVRGYNNLYASRGEPLIAIDPITEAKYGRALDDRERTDTEERERAEKTAWCANRVGEYCSPACPSCRFYGERGTCSLARHAR